MKKLMYIIFPGAMLGIFLVAYFSDLKRQSAKDQEHAIVVNREKKEKDDKELAMRSRAAEEAQKRATERAAVDKKKEDERLAKWNKEGQDVENDTTKSKAAADSDSKEIAKMEAELAKLRDAREKGNRDYLELLKKSQSAQIDRNSAEIEIARLLEMIKRRAGETAAKGSTVAAPARSS